MTRDALLPARDFVALVLRFAGRESDIGVLQMLHAWARTALTHYAAPGWRVEGAAALAEGALRELRQAEPGSEHQLTWARFFAAVASSDEHVAFLQGLLAGTAAVEGLDVDQELRWALLEPLAAHGRADETVIGAELARDDTASGKRHQVRCLAARPSAAVKAQSVGAGRESDQLSNALVEATIAGFAQPSQRELIAPYASKYFDAIERVVGRAVHPDRHGRGAGAVPGPQGDEATLAAADAWLAAHASAAPALRRLVLEARDDLARALRARRSATPRPDCPRAALPAGRRPRLCAGPARGRPGQGASTGSARGSGGWARRQRGAGLGRRQRAGQGLGRRQRAQRGWAVGSARGQGAGPSAAREGRGLGPSAARGAGLGAVGSARGGAGPSAAQRGGAGPVGSARGGAGPSAARGAGLGRRQRARAALCPSAGRLHRQSNARTLGAGLSPDCRRACNSG